MGSLLRHSSCPYPFLPFCLPCLDLNLEWPNQCSGLNGKIMCVCTWVVCEHLLGEFHSCLSNWGFRCVMFRLMLVLEYLRCPWVVLPALYNLGWLPSQAALPICECSWSISGIPRPVLCSSVLRSPQRSAARSCQCPGPVARKARDLDMLTLQLPRVCLFNNWGIVHQCLL